MPLNDTIDPAALTARLWKFYGAVNNQFRLQPAAGGRYLTLEVVEDESDGYRSALDRVRRVAATEDSGPWPRQHAALVQVVDVSDEQNDPMWELREVVNPHVWLTFGTSNSDDYYPSFVFSYTPV